jgi:hypothetical protein
MKKKILSYLDGEEEKDKELHRKMNINRTSLS